jgi:hypothetical protein
MKIHANINERKGKKSTQVNSTGKVDLIVEYSYTPHSMYYVAIEEENSSYVIYTRKIQQIIHGFTKYNEQKIDLTLVEYINEHYSDFLIISGKCDDVNLRVDIEPDIPLNINRSFIIDYDEIQQIPAFRNKSLIECIKYLYESKSMDDHNIFTSIHPYNKNKQATDEIND